MIHLKDTDHVYIDEELSGLARRLVEDGVVNRQVDLLLLGFAYAVRKRIQPKAKIQRHDLVRVAAIAPDLRLAVEAVAPWYARELGFDPPADSRRLLEFICQLGSAGVAELQKEWRGRTKSQIELSILRLANTTY
jgi:hypothetical protein